MSGTRGAAVLAAVLLLASCGAADDMEAGDAVQQDGAGTAAQPELRAPTGEAAGLAEDVQEVTVSLTEWSIQLSTQDVEAGAVTFDIRNEGTVPHAFEVEGGGEEWSTDPIEAGGQITMSLDLPAGEYRVYCPVDSAGMNHESLGMVTQLRAN